MNNSVKFRADRLNLCGDVAVVSILKMAAVRHLGFVLRLLGPPTKHIVCGVYRCSIFRWNPVCSFEDMRLSILWKFSLKMPINAFWVFWG